MKNESEFYRKQWIKIEVVSFSCSTLKQPREFLISAGTRLESNVNGDCRLDS